MSVKVPKVAIIGAGLGGLISAKEILKKLPNAIINIFEIRNNVGGVWNFENDPLNCDIKFDKYGQAHAAINFETFNKTLEECPPSAMYSNLRTNLPTDLMTFREVPYNPSTPTFPSHKHVLNYLENYSKSNHLNKFVKFRTKVVDIRHSVHVIPYKHDCVMPQIQNDGYKRWIVEYESLNDKKVTVDDFDYVINANGHYVNNYIPYIEGLWTFTGNLLHSRWWRDPLKYRGKKVIVIGSRSSGYDLCRELAWLNVHPTNVDSPYQSKSSNPELEYTKIIQVCRTPSPPWENAPEWYKDINSKPPITSIENDTVRFEDGSEESQVDVIVFATGYNYMFPFINHSQQPFKTSPVVSNPNSSVVLKSEKKIPPTRILNEDIPDSHKGYRGVINLSRHNIFYLNDPTLVFVGLLRNIRPFSLWEAQAHIIAYAFSKPNERIPNRLLEEAENISMTPGDVSKFQLWPFPKEFEMTDDMLDAINEGINLGDENSSPYPQWKWSRTPKWAWEKGFNVIKDKRRLLGY